jgi:hypothetical protein
MALPHQKPDDINGHTWEFIPYARGSKEGSFRCSTCLTSHDLGHGRDMKCDKGEGFRKAVKKSTGK